MSISTILVRVIVDAVEKTGVLRDEFLRSLKIDPARLSRAEGRFDLEEFVRLEVRALDVTQDEALGLHIAERAPVTAFDLMSHLTSHAPTMREAFRLVVQFQHLLMDDCHIALKERGGSATIHYSFTRSQERADRMHAEFVVSALLRFARAFGGDNLGRRVAAFEHPRPPHCKEYVRLFGDAVRFDQPQTAFTFDRAVLDREHLHQHPELFALLRSQAQRALERVAHGLGTVDQVQQYLLAYPPARIPDLSTAARDLGLSNRTLRRLLATETTSYRSLVRAVRKSYADHMLRDPKRSIQETASALGFANVRAFHRAFKQWTGMTPGEYRGRRGPVAPADSEQ
jgi:AraC-like DNA-binding protein